MARIFRLFDRTSNAKQWSIKAALQDVLAQITERKIPEEAKCIVISLDDRDGKYVHTYTQAGMSLHEIVALLEVVKHDIIMTTKED